MDLLINLLAAQCLAVVVAYALHTLAAATHAARDMRAHVHPYVRARREMAAMRVAPCQTNRLRILGMVNANGPGALVLT